MLPQLAKLPKDIPATPYQTYKDKGWSSWGDWLGTGVIASYLIEYRSFEEARAFVHSLRLKSGAEWSAYCKGQMPQLGVLPADIPANPNQTYKDKGWVSRGDWLGTGSIAPNLKEYRSFKEARAFARSLDLKSSDEWRAYCKGQMPHLGMLPTDIPASPRKTYKDKGWVSMGDWLGTGVIASHLREYRAFNQARSFVRGLGLRSKAEWKEYCTGQMPHLKTLPADIPANPNQTYKAKGWSGWGDWLGTGVIASHLREYRPFEKARAFACGLNLRSRAEWSAYCKGKLLHLETLPADIPASPERTYKDKGWLGMGDWLGTGGIAPRLRKYRPFEKARTFIHSLHLKNQREWNAYYKGQMLHLGKLPKDIPTAPYSTYKDKGWTSLGDWLGTGAIAPRLREYRSFEKARVFVRKLRLKSATEWKAYCKGEMFQLEALPADIPASPYLTYKDKGWAGMGDWLGTGVIATHLREYRSFEKARIFVHKLRLKSVADWRAYCKGEIRQLRRVPADIPSSPDRTYYDRGWSGWGDWLGTHRTRVSKSPKRKS